MIGENIETETVTEVWCNRELNGLSKSINLQAGQPSRLKIPASFVINNMLLHELLDVLLHFARFTIHEGVLICIGFLGEQEYDPINSFPELGFELF